MRSQAAAPEGVRLKFIDADVAALREADGAVVVIDIVEGCYAAIVTCGELRQCLSQARSIKPVLVLTKLDRAFLELQLVNVQTAHAPPHSHTRARHRTLTHTHARTRATAHTQHGSLGGGGQCHVVG